MSGSRPPRSTSTPTSRSKSEQSRAPPLPTLDPGATSHPTRSSPSSTRSDYADPNQPDPPTTHGSPRPSRHNPKVGIVAMAPMHEGVLAEHVLDRLAQRLDSVNAVANRPAGRRLGPVSSGGS